MIFDTLDKKPKVWNIAVLSALCLGVAAVMSLILHEDAALPVSFLVECYILIVICMLLNAWVKQIRYNPYSYNTIYYMGFAIFAFFSLVIQSILTYSMITGPETPNYRDIVYLLLYSSGTFVMVTSPFIIIFSGALVISNIALIRHEGMRLVNLLGIILAFLLLGGEGIIYSFDRFLKGGFQEILFKCWFLYIISAIYLYIECMLLGTIIANILVVKIRIPEDKDFVIILGCAIRSDGSLTPLLQGRADRALEYASKVKEKTGKDVIFVTSGGRGKDEVISESLAMKRYLMEKGIPEERIIEEDRSTDTDENMRYSKEKIDALNKEGKVVFATTNYHVFRSGTYARKAKMRAVGIGSKTKWYFWPNASVREFISLLTEHRGKQLLIFTGLIVFYTVLTLLALVQ